MVEHGTRNGSLDLYDWDQAIAIGLGAQYDQTKNEWYLPLKMEVVNPNDGIHTPITRALVVYKRPEPTSVDFILPQISIIRDNVVPAANRLLTPVEQFKVPAEGAQMVSAGGEVGWTAYDVKDKEEPYDLSYTIEFWARYRIIAQSLLQIGMAKYPIRGRVKVIDSEGVDRLYAVYQQGTTDVTQLSSMVDRVPGFALSLKVEGELTLDKESFTLQAFTGGTSSTPVAGINDNDPNPGPGGLYGTGKPIIRTGLVEDV